MTISEQEIKQFLQEKNYTQIIFSPKGRVEIWDPAPPYNCPVQPLEELPHDNFVKITCYVSSGAGMGYGVSGTEKDCIEEIKEADSNFLTQLFQWTKKEGIKRINTKASVEATDYIPGTNTPTNSKLVIEEVIIVKKTQQDYKNDREAYARRADQMIANRKCSYCNGHIKPEAKDCLQHLKNCSLCPEAIKDFAKDKMIELGLDDKDDGQERERERDKIGEIATIYPVDSGEVDVKGAIELMFC